jgi:transposase
VLIWLAVRLLACGNAACPRARFAEQPDGLAVPYARVTPLLAGQLGAVAVALAGRAGSRLARAVLAVQVSRHALVRVLMALPGPAAGPVRVLGIDDFSLKKGRAYATLLVNMETGEPVDVLPDREAGTAEKWLRAHPEVEVICRDRAGAYAEGAAAGAPAATQVADRWHLWHNLGEYAEKAVAAHRGCLAAAASGAPDGPPAGVPPGQQAPQDAAATALPPGPGGLLDVCGRERPLVTRTRERHAAVHDLLAAGHTQAGAARILDLDPDTVHRYASQPDVAPLLVKATSRDSRLDPFKPWITRRWNEGVTSAAALHAEMAATLGWAGSLRSVQRYVAQFRPADGRTRAGRAARPAPPAPAIPKTRQVTRWLLTRPARLDPAGQAGLAAVTAACPHLSALAGHIRAFAEMMTRRQGLLALDDWLTAVEADDQPDLHSFARGIRLDQQAVTAGLALPYSSAALEGNVTKIKMIKRQMYGRAGFPLLRKRVILHPG